MSEQLSPLDATFLELEEADETAHMHIGAMLIFEAPTMGVPSVSEVRARMAERLPRLPRYGQRLSATHTGVLSWPSWVAHEAFDIADHVWEAALPAPGGEAELHAWAADFWSRRLDRRLPLWEVVLLTGLEDGRFALVTKTHHAMVDGVGSVEAGFLLLDPAPEAEPEPEHAPAAEHDGTGPRHRALAGLAHAALHPRETLHHARGAFEVLVRDEVIAAPHTSLNEPIGTRRRYASVTTTLAETKAIKAALGGTVNDVALAAVTGGLRAILEHRGETPPAHGLRAMVPVNVRQAGEQLGNHVTSLFVHLPVAASTPEDRYCETVAESQRLKSGRQADGGATVVDVAGLAPPVLHSFLARSLFASRLFNVTVTNVPGPPVPLWAFGARMRRVLPLVPLAAQHAVGVAIISYDGTLTFGVSTDHETVPDIDVLVAGIERSLAELRDLAAVPGPAPAPA